MPVYFTLFCCTLFLSKETNKVTQVERVSTEFWSCNAVKTKIYENLYFLVTNVLSVSKLIVWYLNMSSIDLSTRCKIGMYLLNREKRY